MAVSHTISQLWAVDWLGQKYHSVSRSLIGLVVLATGIPYSHDSLATYTAELSIQTVTSFPPSCQLKLSHQSFLASYSSQLGSLHFGSKGSCVACIVSDPRVRRRVQWLLTLQQYLASTVGDTHSEERGGRQPCIVLAAVVMAVAWKSKEKRDRRKVQDKQERPGWI